jgi:hypothetical protein
MKVKFMKLILPILFLFSSVIIPNVFPCTVAVVSGKATPDGRPLLWKNRDTMTLENKMRHFEGEKFGFIGLIDTFDTEGVRVWAGINTKGFALMNSLARDLYVGELMALENGTFIKTALGECANISDFEKLLERTKGKRRIGANFGVIDAEGNACFFETSNTAHEKFDANDPHVAPFGYIIRTNFAYTSANKDVGAGYIRFERASHLFQTARSEGRLDHKFIIQEAARDLVNEKLHSYPLTNPAIHDPSTPLFINTSHTINRNLTASVTVFHGALSLEKAHLATMWILLGQPVSTVAIPLWAHASNVPTLLSGKDNGNSPLNEFSRRLASYLYPDKRGYMEGYLNVTRLKNYDEEGVLAKLFRIENQVIALTENKLNGWKNSKPSNREILEFEEQLVSRVFENLKDSFPNIKLPE